MPLGMWLLQKVVRSCDGNCGQKGENIHVSAMDKRTLYTVKSQDVEKGVGRLGNLFK